MFELIVNNSYTVFAEEISADALDCVDAGSMIFVPETNEHYLLVAPGELILVSEEELDAPATEEPEVEEPEADGTEEDETPVEEEPVEE